MNDCCKKYYSRGYNTGSRNAWPAHRPPTPPNECVKNLMQAAEKLRDIADNICATLLADDVFVEELSPGIDGVDEAMEHIASWLLRRKKFYN